MLEDKGMGEDLMASTGSRTHRCSRIFEPVGCQPAFMSFHMTWFQVATRRSIASFGKGIMLDIYFDAD